MGNLFENFRRLKDGTMSTKEVPTFVAFNCSLLLKNRSHVSGILSGVGRQVYIPP
jgi:hypothetical protein